MAVIPPDAGVRLRLQAEQSLVQALQPVRPIPADLPDLQPGQTFTARLLEPLPGNTFRAMVSGRQFTLQLPEGAGAGDTLELVVVERTPQAIVARRAEGTPAAPAAPQYAYAKISTAGRAIGELLLPESGTPRPAPLNGGQPMVAQPPAGQGVPVAELARALARAVSQSGLFYEAHQAEWLAGQRPTESLRAEPQGRLPVEAPPAGPQRPETAAEGTKPLPPAGGRPAGEAAAPRLSIPEEIRPIVQQQLDAVVTQRLAWHGEAWPGQPIDWEIEQRAVDEGSAQPNTEENGRWQTRLRLALPRLGALEAVLQLVGSGLRLELKAEDEAAAADLRAHLSALAEALARAGVPLQSSEVRGGTA